MNRAMPLITALLRHDQRRVLFSRRRYGHLAAPSRANAGKAEVIAAMRALGHPVTDDNEADALAILHWALGTRHPGGVT